MLLAYEKSGYDNTRPGRLPDLLDNVSVDRLVKWQADAVKILLYYTPFEDEKVNDIKHAFIERIGAECDAHEIPFFLELVGYDPQGGDEHSVEYAKRKPEMVRVGMEEFSKGQYRVDVLKVEIPVSLPFVKGSSFFRGTAAYTRPEALDHFRRAASAAVPPFIYLSAGVNMDEFIESLRMAGEASVDYSGVLCGRATWKDGIPVYAQGGLTALEKWLQDKGVENITALNEAIRTAKPWYLKTGKVRPAGA